MKNISQAIRDKAIELGFEGCGMLPVRELLGYGEKLKERQAAFPMAPGPTADMLARYADISPVYPWAKAVIVCTSAYNDYIVPEALKGHVGRYYMFDHKLQAQSRVYKNIEAFEAFIRELGVRAEKELHGVTSARWAAEQAGLGIVRKNNFLFTKSGSLVIIDTWAIDEELEYREQNSFTPCPAGCEKCIKACPTGALCGPHCMNMSKCVTLLTWGLKDLPPEPVRGPLGQWIYGCDACQDLCPFNAKLKAGEREYPGLKELAEAMTLVNIVRMDYDELTKLLAARFWFIRPENIWVWKTNALRAMANDFKEEYREAIQAARSDGNEKVRAMAEWAAEKTAPAEQTA
jgi:epoxyqueuosine reductase